MTHDHDYTDEGEFFCKDPEVGIFEAFEIKTCTICGKEETFTLNEMEN